MKGGLTLTVRAPDPDAFAPYGSFVERPDEYGGRAHFEEWLGPVGGRAPHYHLNRVMATSLPVTIDRVEQHPHAPQLFLPIGVSRYLVTVMPSDDSGAPDPSGAIAFVLPGTMGIVYRAGAWHTGISSLDGEGSFAVMMWRGGDDDVFAAIDSLEVGETPPPSGSGRGTGGRGHG